MPKQNRKRKHDTKREDFEIDVPKMKFKPHDEEAEMEEEKLSHILFGGARSFLQCLEEAEKEAAASNVDSGVGEDDSGESNDEKRPAWTDEDDDGIEVGQALDAQRRRLPDGGVNSRTDKYSNLLKHKFTSAFGTPGWAELKKRKRSDSDSDDEVLRSCGFITETAHASIPPSVLEFKKVKDLNSETRSEGPYINSIEFHPTSSVSLVAGNSGIASLFAVDGRTNNKLHSVSFEKFPIVCAKFSKDGNEAILGSRHPHMFCYDLITAKPTRVNLPPGLTQFKKFVVSPDGHYIAAAGKWGEVYVLSAVTKERLFLLKQESEVTALAFNPSGNLLFGHSDSGEVTVWDTTARRVRHRFVDEGCLQGTTLTVSSSNQFLASGSAQGVVNVYGMEDLLKSKVPKPRKTIMNLTTAITDLKFNPSSEILALASVEVQNAVRLFHVGSGTVFSNFPNFQTKMGQINTLNFSPGSGYISFGNRKSVVSLYRLKHYKNY